MGAPGMHKRSARAREGPLRALRPWPARRCLCRPRGRGRRTRRLKDSRQDLESTHASSLGQCVSHMEDHVEEACRVPGPSGGIPEKEALSTPGQVQRDETCRGNHVRLQTEGQEPAAPPSEMSRRCARRPGRGLILGSPDGAPRGFVGRGRRGRARRVCVSTASSALEGPLVGGGVVKESAVIAEPKDALEETLSSLDYAMKAKNIENKSVTLQVECPLPRGV